MGRRSGEVWEVSVTWREPVGPALEPSGHVPEGWFATPVLRRENRESARSMAGRAINSVRQARPAATEVEATVERVTVAVAEDGSYGAALVRHGSERLDQRERQQR